MTLPIFTGGEAPPGQPRKDTVGSGGPSRPRRIVGAALVLLVTALVLVAAVFAYGAVTAVHLKQAFDGVTRVPLDIDASRARLGGPQPNSPQARSPQRSPADGRAYRSYLVVGSDAREGLGGSRADVIMLALVPRNDAAPTLVSLPRDLYVDNPCTGLRSRINSGLAGCGDKASGVELLSVMVEDYTGVALDHVVGFTFAGFQRIIDTVGGIDVCVDAPVREPGGSLDLPAGCSRVDGQTALAWVRSRHTQEFVGGQWRTVPGVSDLTRNRRQQEVLLQLLGRVGSFRSLRNFSDLVDRTADAVTLDRGFSLNDAVSGAWELRGLDPASVRRPQIPVRNVVTADGAQVLEPTQPFREVLSEVYPAAYRN